MAATLLIRRRVPRVTRCYKEFPVLIVPTLAVADYYPNCDVQFKGLPNIHSVRKSFQLLRNTLASEDQTR